MSPDQGKLNLSPSGRRTSRRLKPPGPCRDALGTEAPGRHQLLNAFFMATGALGLGFIRGQQQTFEFAAAMLAAVFIQRHAYLLLIHQVSMDYFDSVVSGLTAGSQDFLDLVDR